MDCVNQPVVHKRFGSGRIKRIDGNTMQVFFTEYGTRNFLYPDAFEAFLKASDPEFAETVAEALKQAQKEASEKQAAAIAEKATPVALKKAVRKSVRAVRAK